MTEMRKTSIIFIAFLATFIILKIFLVLEKFFQSCSESEIACDNNIGCFSHSQTCDGTADCQDGSDEFLYRCKRSTDITFG